jgi:hypothetical protein
MDLSGECSAYHATYPMELVANRLTKRDDIIDKISMASVLPTVGLCISKALYSDSPKQSLLKKVYFPILSYLRTNALTRHRNQKRNRWNHKSFVKVTNQTRSPCHNCVSKHKLESFFSTFILKQKH